MSEIIVNSKTSLLTTMETLVNDINNSSSSIESSSASLTSISNCDDIDLSSAANTISSNFTSIFTDFSNVGETARNYISNLISFDINDFATNSNSSSTTGSESVNGQTLTSGENETSGSTTTGSSSSNYYSDDDSTTGGSASESSPTGGTTSSSSTTSNAVDESIIETAEGTEVILPEGLGSVRTYMGWQCITNTSSQQYKLIEAAGMNFDEEGFGVIGDRYVVATTTTYGNVGDYIDVYQEDGSVLKCVIGDIKNQNDDGCNKWGHLNGECVLESVVDKNTWYNGNRGGHSNPGTASCHPEWNQDIVKIVNKGNYFDYMSQQ